MNEATRIRLKEMFEEAYNPDDVIDETLKKVEDVLELEEFTLNYSILPKDAFDDLIPAVYLPKKEAIIFNNEWVKTASKEDLIFHTIFTSRYAYQHLSIIGKIKKENPEVIKCWKDNFNNYERPTGNIIMDSDLLKRDMEIDARAFSNLLMKRIYDIDYEIPKNIKDDIFDHMRVLDLRYFNKDYN